MIMNFFIINLYNLSKGKTLELVIVRFPVGTFNLVMLGASYELNEFRVKCFVTFYNMTEVLHWSHFDTCWIHFLDHDQVSALHYCSALLAFGIHILFLR